MYLIFVDDAKQRPTREGFKGNLVAVGGLVLAADKAGAIEQKLEQLCDRTGFTRDEEFKWSPNRGHWMTKNLVGDERQAFHREVVGILASAGATICVVMEDDGRGQAIADAPSPQHDVLQMLFERASSDLRRMGQTGILISDTPPGNRSEENRFVADCLESIADGTQYVKPHEIVLVLTANSKHVRLLQAADLVVSCLTAYVAGEGTYSPVIAREILDLCSGAQGARGGTSIKIHPDFSFANLYHWLLGDSTFWKSGVGTPLPISSRQYAASADVA